MTVQNTPALETDRLILRRFTGQDVEAIYDICRDEEANTYLPWFCLTSLEEAGRFLEETYLQFYKQPCGYRYAICLKNDDVPIGYVHAGMDDSHDFGYGLRTEFWHQGIISEAGQAVIGQLKKDGIPYITATHDIKNPRSGSVMKRLGMHYRYSYEEQWMPKNIPVTFRMYQLNLDGKDNRVYKTYWNQSKIHFVEAGI